MSENQPARPASIWLNLLIVYIVWGSTYLAIRFAVETLPPFLMASARFLIAGGVLFAVRRLAGDPMPTARQWKSAAIIGSFLLLGGNGLVSWAEQVISSGAAALLVGTTPLWFTLLDALLQRKMPRGSVILGVITGFAGIVLLVAPWDQTSTGAVNLLGAAAVVLATLLWAGGSLYSRKAELPASPLMGPAVEMLAGGVALLIFGTLVGDWGRLDLSAVSLRSLGGVAYLIVFGSILAYSAYTWLLRNAPTPLVATYAYVNPIVAVLLGALLASEPLTPRVLLAAAVIIGSVVLITRAPREKITSREAAEIAKEI